MRVSAPDPSVERLRVVVRVVSGAPSASRSERPGAGRSDQGRLRHATSRQNGRVYEIASRLWGLGFGLHVPVKLDHAVTEALDRLQLERHMPVSGGDQRDPFANENRDHADDEFVYRPVVQE